LRRGSFDIMQSRSSRVPVYQLFMLALCVLALGLLVIQYAFRLDPEIEEVLDYADNVICVGFLIDFAITFWRAPNRRDYFLRWGWLDLLSSIPTLDYVRWGRLARIARIARVLRGVRAMRLLTTAMSQQRGQSTLVIACLLAIVLILGSSTVILHFETGPDANIKSAEDALWWSFATIATVGYGDKFPVSTEGRVVAAMLMTAGVGLFGAFSAALAAWFIAPQEEGIDREVIQLREEIVAIRKLLEQASTNATAINRS